MPLIRQLCFISERSPLRGSFTYPCPMLFFLYVIIISRQINLLHEVMGLKSRNFCCIMFIKAASYSQYKTQSREALFEIIFKKY